MFRESSEHQCGRQRNGLHHARQRPGGGIWGSQYLFPAKVLSRLFRGKLLAALTESWNRGELTCRGLKEPSAFPRLRDALYKKEWVVYAKTPFGGPAQVFNYLGRYTHRVAISNQRLLALDEDGVRFVTRGEKTATLAPHAFIGRFLQHVLPDGFVKIRHFGLLAAGNVNTKLLLARRLLLEARRAAPPKVVLPLLALFVALYRPPPGDLGWRDRMILLTGIDPLRCRRCGASLLRTALPSTRDQPAHLDSS